MYKVCLAGLALVSVTTSCTTVNLNDGDASKTFSKSDKSTYAKYVPERKDDFAWENDLVAFRAYGPKARSGAENAGVDCWLKRVEYPIIDKWYDRHFIEGISYHEDHGEGLDNYHVGHSAGCGGTSLWLSETREPLETWVNYAFVEQSKQKTSFKLYYDREIDGKNYQEEKQITIELGQRLYSVESTFFINGKPAKNLPVTVGITTHDGKAAVKYNAQKGWLAGWEVLDGHGLGTAVLVDPQLVKSFKLVESNGIKDNGHALLIMNTDHNGRIAYKSGYGWEKAGEITTFEKWKNYLNTQTIK